MNDNPDSIPARPVIPTSVTVNLHVRPSTSFNLASLQRPDGTPFDQLQMGDFPAMVTLLVSDRADLVRLRDTITAFLDGAR